ncbi:MAG: heparan-alpha-glucosaminide N-acetyltransferase domain-containing protein [Promethearchaeota archaeon]
MKRIKSIDTFRGWCMFMMVLGHMLSWWVRHEDHWLTFALHSIFGDIVGTGFLFFSGVSTVIYLRSRLTKAETSDDKNIKQVNNEYLFRAIIILILALLYSSATAVGTLDPLDIWKWYIPLTIAISLLLSFFLLKTSKSFRIIIAVIFWISHYYILSILLPYEGQVNIFGAIYHVLYHGLHPILYYFSFFLVGTVVGDVMLEIFLREDQKERRLALKNKFLLPSLIMGTILILFAVLFLFPDFLIHETFASTIYSLGVILTSFSVLLILEEFEVIKVKKSYRFFYFYSFYSFTIYFSHNIIYFIFLNQLNALNFWIAAIGTFILLSLLIRFMYKNYGAKVSLKAQIGRVASILARKVEEKKKEQIELLNIKK